jgi:H+/Cl- antiporter ClcA
METTSFFGMFSNFIGFFFVLIFGLISLAALAFWIWMIVDCATKETSEGHQKIVWILVILLANFLGALIYFLVRKLPRRT